MIYKSILIPTDGSKAYEGIIEFICSIQKITQSTIYVTYILEVPRNLPLNADLPEKSKLAKSALQNAVAIAEKHNVTLETSVVYARSADEAIITTAEDLKCDVVVIVQANHKLGFFGDSVASIYQKAKCNVWLFNNKLT